MAKAATTTIPIVFTTGGDPVQIGLVASLGRPGGNVTGVTNVTVEVAPKRLELAHELVPQASVFGLLINPGNPLAENVKRDSQAAALKLGLQLNVQHATTDAELDRAFTAFREMQVGAVVIGTDGFLMTTLNTWLHWRSAIRCPRFISITCSWQQAAWLAMGAAS